MCMFSRIIHMKKQTNSSNSNFTDTMWIHEREMHLIYIGFIVLPCTKPDIVFISGEQKREKELERERKKHTSNTCVWNFIMEWIYRCKVESGAVFFVHSFRVELNFALNYNEYHKKKRLWNDTRHWTPKRRNARPPECVVHTASAIVLNQKLF